MTKNYKPIGDYIQKVEHRNRDLRVTRLLGLSMTKEFRETTSNIVGTDMSVYRVMSKYQFACDFMSPIRVNKLPVVLKLDDEPNLVSPAYPVFEITDRTKLDPEYLMMWFRRPEFDRYATFKCDAAIRGGYEWKELCETLIPIPSITKQREIVKEYNVIQNRIDLNQQLIQKLEETAQTIYKQWFVDGIDLENLPEGWMIKKLADFCEIKGGKRLPKGSELNDEKEGNPYIKVADMTKDKFVVLNDSFQFVSNDIQKSISRYIVQTADIIISIVGTIGLVNIVDSTLLNANLTENCYRLTNFKVVHSDYLYYYLVSPFGKKEIESRTVGGVQAKLPMYNVQSLPIVLPKTDLLQKFEKSLNPINQLQNTLTIENHKLSELKDLLLSKLATIEN
jgi:type I restriction enzyme, S subunit